MNRAIGFSGKMRVGKTETANWLSLYLHELGIPTIKFAFGSPIKMETSQLYGYPRNWGYESENKIRPFALENLTKEGYELAHTYIERFKPLSFEEAKKEVVDVRYLLQMHGTGIRRTYFGDDYWENIVFSQIDKIRSDNVVLIFDDIRFPTEIPKIRDLEMPTRIYRLLPYKGWDHESDHSSEHLLDDWTDYDKCFDMTFGGCAQVALEVLKLNGYM